MEAGYYYAFVTNMNPIQIADILVKSHNKIKTPKEGLSPDKPESASELTSINGGYIMPENHSKDYLAYARYAGNDVVELRFGDGLFAGIDIAELGIDLSTLKPESARASWGSAVEIDMIDGDTFHIDSAVLRAHCDPEYAAELETSIQQLTGTPTPAFASSEDPRSITIVPALAKLERIGRQ